MRRVMIVLVYWRSSPSWPAPNRQPPTRSERSFWKAATTKRTPTLQPTGRYGWTPARGRRLYRVTIPRLPISILRYSEAHPDNLQLLDNPAIPQYTSIWLLSNPDPDGNGNVPNSASWI